MSKLARIGALGAVTMTVVVLLASPAFAHAILLSSEPPPAGTLAAPPPAVNLRFNEPVEVVLGAVRVYDGDAQRVVTGAPRHPADDQKQVRVSLPKLDDGTYVVTWRVTSADSHPVEGAYTFQVGATSTVKNPQGLAARLLSTESGSTTVGFLYAVVRATGFAALSLLIGGACFLAIVYARGRTMPRARMIVWAGWIGTVVVTVVAVAFEGLYAAALPITKLFDATVFSDVLDTRFGKVALARLVLLALAFPLLKILLPRAAPDDMGPAPALRPWWWVAAGLVGVGLSLTPGVAGHAASGDYQALAVPADVVHVVAMAVWLGGLVVLAAVVLPRKDPVELRPVLVRYSGIALGCIVALVVSGGFQAWRQVRTFEALRTTDYGRVLIVKLIVFAVLVIAAAFSREVVNRRFRFVDFDDDEDEDDDDEVNAGDLASPADAAREPIGVAAARAGFGPVRPGMTAPAPLEPAAAGRHGPATADGDDGDDEEDDFYDDEHEIRRLRRSVLAEVVIAAVILAVTAVLVNAPPARSISTAPVDVRLKSANLWVDVVLSPGSAGGNDIHVYSLPTSGGIANVSNMDMQLTKVGADLPPFEVPLRNYGGGHFYAPLFDIPYPGRWRMTVRAQTSPTEESVLTGNFTLR